MTGDIDKIKGIKQELPSPKKLQDTRDPEVFREKYLKVGETEEEQKHDPKKNKKSKQAEEEKEDQKKIAAPEGPQAEVAFRDVVSGADLESSELDAGEGVSAKRNLGTSREEGATSGKSAYAPTVSEEDYWGGPSADIQYGEEPAAETPLGSEAPETAAPKAVPNQDVTPPESVPTEAQSTPVEPPEQHAAPPPPEPEAPPLPPEPTLPAEPPPVNQPGQPQQEGQPPEQSDDVSSQGQPVQGQEQKENDPNQQSTPEDKKVEKKGEKKGEKGAVEEFMLGEMKPKKMTLKQKRFIAKQKKLEEARQAKKGLEPTEVKAKTPQAKPEDVQKAGMPEATQKEQAAAAPVAAASAHTEQHTGKKGEQHGPVKTAAGHTDPVSNLETDKHEGDSDKGDQEQDDQQDAQAYAATRGVGMEGITPITGFDTAIPGVEPVQQAARTLMPSEMDEIINRCAGVITVMKATGQTTTTVQVSIPGSVFDGSSIVLTQSDTARGSYNLQFQGTPEAIEVFNQNVAELAAALQGRRFEINILSPELTKKHRASYRVQSAKDKGKK
ncbi:MAG: hypothetical protein SP1CHLAM54_17440 [Chlamydiia bacterium]|nr:hypothetical protein [Chlamydiia bacterium]MCH9616632.1 hypothetical protein [Chlamydiia bacterium]MCH9629363.1 hypothetical protein [Chlamydiia bacterium]